MINNDWAVKDSEMYIVGLPAVHLSRYFSVHVFSCFALSKV
jgi:hypothetical protein